MMTISFALHDVAPYINWLYFFHAWGFPARLGSIAKVHGCEACRLNWLQAFDKEEQPRAREAMRLYDEARTTLQRLDATFRTHARWGLFDAFSDGDDIVIGHPTETQEKSNTYERRIPLLRQQKPGNGGVCLSLSDFIRPASKLGRAAESLEHPATPKDPYAQIGLFACAADTGIEELQNEDEYQHLLHQTLADRLAEATAEKLHEMVRTELWGYAPDEHLSVEELFAEHYQGRRPAVGYPSLPDQSLNFILDEILDFGSIGITLTENGAMRPHASTSGLMLAHPDACHFSIGQIGDDQLAAYAKRRGMKPEEIRRFVNTNC